MWWNHSWNSREENDLKILCSELKILKISQDIRHVKNSVIFRYTNYASSKFYLLLRLLGLSHLDMESA